MFLQVVWPFLGLHNNVQKLVLNETGAYFFFTFYGWYPTSDIPLLVNGHQQYRNIYLSRLQTISDLHIHSDYRVDEPTHEVYK